MYTEIKENQLMPSHRSNKGQILSVGYPQKPNRAPQRYDVFGTRVSPSILIFPMLTLKNEIVIAQIMKYFIDK